MNRVLACAVLLSLWAPCVLAQRLHGTVRDSSGAVIPFARVMVEQGGRRVEQSTDASGAFEVAAVEPGAALEVQAKGFAPFRQRIADPGKPVAIVLSVLPLTQELVITPQRSPIPVAQADSAIVRFPGDTLAASGGATLDEKLRQVPGFTLLRRTGSRAANPTTQGASLRGLAASGASRVLLLDDGIPLNDPFGGWIYWERVPAESIESVEVMEGGGSHLYGSGALAGLVNVFQRPPTSGLTTDISFGNEKSPNVSVDAGRSSGPWFMGASAETFRTSGYTAVVPPDRGAVDSALTLRYATCSARILRNFARDDDAFASVSLFNEGRGNGTPLQVNSTRLAELRAGVDLAAGPGRLALRGFGSAQRYNQTFSAVTSDRSRETLTTWQRVTAQQAGGTAQWTGMLRKRHTVAAGMELRQVRGVSNELNFRPAGPTASAGGGRQTLLGAFGADSIRLWRVTFTIGARLDHWSDEPLAGQGAHDGVAVSPHAGAVVPLRAGFLWTASAYRSFRAPTLNELYRNFRVGSILTLANAALDPEHLSGAETGIGFVRANFRAHADVFWAEVTDPVANTTLRVTPQLITRQRENLGSLRSRGLELAVESRLGHHLSVRGAYLFVDATVLSFPANPALVGLFIPQVPRHGASFGGAYTTSRWTVSLQARTSGRQFDDDQNQLPLDPMFDLDVFASRRISSLAELYVAAENALDQRAMVGRTPTPVWGSPVLFRAGLRLRLGRR